MNTENTAFTALVPVIEDIDKAHISSELLLPILPTPRPLEPKKGKSKIDIRAYLRDFFLAFLLGLLFFGAGAFTVLRELLQIFS